MANPWKMQLVNTARGSFEVFTKGKGKPLCVTHYYSEYNHTGDVFADVFTSNHKVHIINLKGAGHSSKINENEDIGFLETVKDLEAVRQTLRINKWTFAGHSTGGMLGLVYGVKYGKALESLILVGTAASKDYMNAPGCIYREDHPHYEHMQNLLRIIQTKETPNDIRDSRSRERKLLSLFDPKNFDSVFPADVYKKTAVPRLNYFSQVEIQNYDLTNKLSEVHIPTLILCGEHDVQCPVTCSQEMHKRIPKSQCVIFPYSNHYPFAEEPVAFQQAIDHFFTTVVRT